MAAAKAKKLTATAKNHSNARKSVRKKTNNETVQLEGRNAKSNDAPAGGTSSSTAVVVQADGEMLNLDVRTIAGLEKEAAEMRG
jgi:hypothetical protein